MNTWVVELLIGFPDVALLPSRDSFSTTFLRNCGRGESLMITTCPKTAVGGKQGDATCKILLSKENLFLVSVKFHGNHKIVTKMR